MERASVVAGASGIFDRWWIAVVLSALYPTIFAASNNWYLIGLAKMPWLFAIALAVSLAVWVAVESLIYAVLITVGQRASEALVSWLRPALYAIVCTSLLFICLAATFRQLLGSTTLVWLTFIAATIGAAHLFHRGLKRHFSLALAALAVLASASWAASWAEMQFSAQPAPKLIAESGTIEQAKFVERPNVYFFIYDAYGSEAAYRDVFKFDNAAQYAALAQRKFKVVHTFSNYGTTWPTTLGVFLGRHHYYSLSAGVDDTLSGRLISAGLSPNPVYETMWSNGYRIQHIHGINYFSTERGKLDFVPPQEPIVGALRIYGSPVISALLKKNKLDGDRTLEEQRVILSSRLPEASAPNFGPWFTFSHVNVPGHSVSRHGWRELEYFEEEFIAKTKIANTHMLALMDQIIAKDPHAIIAIIGDHGGYRFRYVWNLDTQDINNSFRMAGVTPEIVAQDVFGSMIAIRSAGRCDDYVYPGLTSVNLMRVIFACLSNNRRMLENREPDLSIFRSKRKLWLVAKDGAPLGKWLPIEEPSTSKRRQN